VGIGCNKPDDAQKDRNLYVFQLIDNRHEPPLRYVEVDIPVPIIVVVNRNGDDKSNAWQRGKN